MQDPLKPLDDLIANLKGKKEDGERSALISSIQKELVAAVKPVFEAMAKALQGHADSIGESLKNVQIAAPDMHMPEMKFPEMKAPVVNLPAPIVNIPAPIVNIPAMQFPEMPVFDGRVNMENHGITRKKPIPVMLVDDNGKPYVAANYTAGGSSGNIRAIKDILSASGVSLVDVTTPTAPALRTTATLSVTGSLATALVDSSGVQYSGSNPLPTTASVSLTLATGQGDGASATRFIQAGDTVSSVIVNSGTITAVTNITNTVAAAIVDSSGVAYSGSNPVPTSATLSVPQGQGDSATAMRVIMAGDAVGSVAITGINGPVGQGDTASALRVVHAGDSAHSVATQSTGLNETTSGVLRVVAMTDSNSSVNVTTFNGNAPAVGLNETNSGVLRVAQMTDVVSSVVVNSGTITTVTTLTGVTNSIQTVTLDRDGNPWQPFTQNQGDVATALRVVLAGNADSSVVVNSGTVTNLQQFNGNAISTNQGDTSPGTLRVIVAGDSATSVFVTGQNDSMLTYIARTTLPTAKADGADVRPVADKYGRSTMRPIQVRDLISTAYVSLTTGTEATFLAASAGKLYDLVWILMSNQSTAAVQVDVRPVTAGNILMTFQVPANGTVGIAPPVPLPGGADTGNNWTVDMPDITGTTVNITGLFTQEI